MADTPIIFSKAMVLALLREARAARTGKTQTRRFAWSWHKIKRESQRRGEAVGPLGSRNPSLILPAPIAGKDLRATPWQRVNPGDRLWVRENLRINVEMGNVYYDADDKGVGLENFCKLRDGLRGTKQDYRDRIVPCIHMPRFASRLSLVVCAVRVERLQAITEDDASAEGWRRADIVSDDPEVHRDAARDWYSDLWESLHGVESWRENPEVVVLTFAVHETNIDALPKAQVA